VNQAKLGPSVAVRGAIEVSLNDSLRDALDALVLSGGTPVAVINEQGRAVGSIDIEKISAVLGAEILPDALAGGTLSGVRP
jgi:osmoprotectant transport system ATP-binding protein